MHTPHADGAKSRLQNSSEGMGPTDREVALPSMPRKKAVAVPGWSVGTATQRVKKMLGS